MRFGASTQKPSIVLGSEQADGLQSAVQQWSNANLISTQLAAELLSTIQIQEQGFDWERFAKYSFRLGVLCLAIAVASLVFDELFLKLVKRVTDVPPPLRSAFTAAAAIAVHIRAFRRSLDVPHQIYLNEAIHGIGAVLFALAALQLGEAIERRFKVAKDNARHVEKSAGKDSHSPEPQKKSRRRKLVDHRDSMMSSLVLLLAIVYGIVGLLAQSNFIWSCGMLAFAAYLGAQTGYFFGGYYLGIEYPLKFILAGTSMLVMAYFMPSWIVAAPLWLTTMIWGLLYVFIALWILSIFGMDSSDGELEVPEVLRSSAFWSVVFLAAAIFSVWHGLYYGLSTTKGFGLTFISINMYTKFFEICWKNLYKPLFFTVLALTLALLGNYAEVIWNLKLNGMSIAVSR